VARLRDDPKVASPGDHVGADPERLAGSNHLHEVEPAAEPDDHAMDRELPEDALEAAVVAQHRHRRAADDPARMEEANRL